MGLVGKKIGSNYFVKADDGNLIKVPNEKYYTHVCWLQKWAREKNYEMRIHNNLTYKILDGERIVISGPLKKVWQYSTKERREIAKEKRKIINEMKERKKKAVV